MKNKSELFGLLANILIVVVLLCFIVFGLNKIGIYSLPEPIEKLLGTNNESQIVKEENGSIYDSLSFNEENVAFSNAEIDYNNAIAVLEEVSARDNYSQQICVKHYHNGAERSETMKIVRKDGLFDITVIDSNGREIKRIYEQEGVVKVETPLDSNNVFAAEFEKGNFDISDECGFVLTVDELLKSQPILSESTFVVKETDNDVYLEITFDDESLSYIQTITYSVSLEYGIVTDVVCVENNAVVYTMETELLSPNFS